MSSASRKDPAIVGARVGAVLNAAIADLKTANMEFYTGGAGSYLFGGDSADAAWSMAAARVAPAQRSARGDSTRRAREGMKAGEERYATVATVFDLQAAQYGVPRGLPGEFAAASFDDDTPYTPAWQERITGVPRQQVITVARQFAENADKTHGRSMVIIGAAMNHWYHSDMNYRGVINMLMMCGCIGQSGGGWAHYVGQEKCRPITGWISLANALDWSRPPRTSLASSR